MERVYAPGDVQGMCLIPSGYNLSVRGEYGHSETHVPEQPTEVIGVCGSREFSASAFLFEFSYLAPLRGPPRRLAR